MSTSAARAEPSEPRPFWRRIPPLGVIALAVVSYVPLLLTAPGVVGADTKTYLYLDPARLLSRAPWMWDTHIGLGTVTHQNIGYLWPMGPWYWFFERIGSPDWVAQRLWLATIIFAAGMGVRFMLRELRWVGPGLTVASFAYALSPYLLHYGARISVILLPFAGLPWLIGMASRSVHRGGWRWPAAFALVTLTVGGVNATSLLLVMAGPLLWMVHAVWISREATFRRVVAAGLRITALTAITSLWWIAGLAVQGAFGIPILRFTETYYTVAHAALATELLRGLGYWFFYGRDALGPWIRPAARMTQSIPALALSFALPALALMSGLLTRFRNRGYFLALVLVGLLIGVGAHPWDAATPAGAVFKAWTETDSGLAFRSTPRAVPLIALGLAVMLAAAVAALASRFGENAPRIQTVVAGVLLLMILGNQWALFTGDFVDRNLERPEELPGYWNKAAAAMDAGDHDTRVYEMPGTDFASYRWGNTVDPVTPGLIDRPYTARELIPYGTPSSADMLNAWDIPLQEGRFDPATVAPVAQLLGIGTIAHRGDLRYERFRTPRPDITYRQLLEAPGLSQPEDFGVGVPNDTTPEVRLDDELALGPGEYAPPAPAISLFDVEDPRPINRAVSADSPTVLSGDGAGMVAWAGIGALNPDRPILYSASFADDPEALDSQIDEPGSQLVVTDTNRRQARRWGSVRENDGYTERAGEVALEPDPADNRLDKFPDAGDDSFTVSEQLGDATLSASAYGNPVSYTPADRAVRAMDGDPSTAWRVGAFGEPRGEFLDIRLDSPVTTDTISLQQSQRLANRWITQVEIAFDGGAPITVDLDDSSRGEFPGQQINFDERTFSEARITITDTNLPRMDRYVGVSDVGLAEVTIPGVDPVSEVIRPPTDLLAAAGDSSLEHPLTWLFTRRYANPSEVVVSDEEPTMRRVVDNPVERDYTAYGSVRASTLPTDGFIDDLLGVTGASAAADVRLPGDLRSRATSAIDGDPTTAWQTPINSPTGHSLTVTNPEPFDVDGIDLTVRTDGLHSVPTVLSVSVDGGAPQQIEVPPIAIGDRSGAGDTTTVELPFEAEQISTLNISIDQVDEANSIDWFGGSTTVLPVAVVDLGLPVHATVPAAQTAIDATCRDDLLRVDGTPVPVRIDGTVGQVLDDTLMDVKACGPQTLSAGDSLVETTRGAVTGFDIDRLAFASAPGGDPAPDTLVDGPAPVTAPPENTVAQTGKLAWDMSIRGADKPYWVVLGESQSPGFTATATTPDGGTLDLGTSTVINGYANGWMVDPSVVGPDTVITMKFAPQRMVWVALGLSGVGVLICLVLLFLPGGSARRRRSGSAPEEVDADQVGPARERTMVVRSVNPFAVEGSPLSPGRSMLIALATAITTFVFMGWAVGLAVGLVTTAALALPRGRVFMRILAAASFVAAAGFVVAKEFRGGYMVDFNWMNLFEVTHAWSLTAVALLVLDPLVGRLRGTDMPDVGGDLTPEASDRQQTAPGSSP